MWMNHVGLGESVPSNRTPGNGKDVLSEVVNLGSWVTIATITGITDRGTLWIGWMFLGDGDKQYSAVWEMCKFRDVTTMCQSEGRTRVVLGHAFLKIWILRFWHLPIKLDPLILNMGLLPSFRTSGSVSVIVICHNIVGRHFIRTR